MVLSGGLLESELCRPERGTQLGDELFGSVGVGPEPTGQVAGESVGVSGPVGVLVRRGRVVGGRGVELAQLGQVDPVERRHVTSPVATMHDLRADHGEVGVGLFDPLTLGNLDRCEPMFGAVDLLGGEHGERAGEQRPVHCVGSVVGLVVPVGRLPQHDVCAAFALADLGAVSLPRRVGRPPARRPSAVAGDHRQHQRVPTSIRSAVHAVRQTGTEATPGHPPVARPRLDRCHQIGGHLLEQILCLHLDASFGRVLPARAASATSAGQPAGLGPEERGA